MGNQSSLFSILILIIPIVAVIYFFSKRKKKNAANGFDGTPKKAKKDEVWQTIKKFLAENNENGKEVVYSFVAKRPNPLQEKRIRKAFNAETEAYIRKNNLDKKAIKRYKASRTKEANRELYCIYFVTKNPKTQEMDKPRIFEAEVIQKMTGDKKSPTRRVIVINGLKDFNTEFKWIEPLKRREDIRIAKIKKQKAAKEAKRNAKKSRYVDYNYENSFDENSSGDSRTTNLNGVDRSTKSLPPGTREHSSDTRSWRNRRDTKSLPPGTREHSNSDSKRIKHDTKALPPGTSDFSRDNDLNRNDSKNLEKTNRFLPPGTIDIN